MEKVKKTRIRVKTKSLELLLACAIVTTFFSSQAVAQTPSIYVSYYTPPFYLNHLVFYDEAGTPIYYENDTAYSVPSDYPEYNELVNRYQQNPELYQQWFEEVGYANLNYQRPVASNYYHPQYYLGFPVFYNESGQPIYYIDGEMRLIPRHYSGYRSLIIHYRRNRAPYLRWYNDLGRHYRWYHRPIRTGSYTPLYYDGYLIYYNDSGIPYYYQGGKVIYIPRTHRNYKTYISHYRTHRASYISWQRTHGDRYRNYRQPRFYRHRVVNTHAPRAVRGKSVIRRYRIVNSGRIRHTPRPNRIVHTQRPYRVGHPQRSGQVVPPQRSDRPARVFHRSATRQSPVRVHQPYPPRSRRNATTPSRIDCSRNPNAPECRGHGNYSGRGNNSGHGNRGGQGRGGQSNYGGHGNRGGHNNQGEHSGNRRHGRNRH